MNALVLAFLNSWRGLRHGARTERAVRQELVLLALGVPVALLLAAVLYLGSLYLFPEPRYVFGPQGPRWVPSSPGEAPPITEPVRRAGADVPA